MNKMLNNFLNEALMGELKSHMNNKLQMNSNESEIR